MKLMSFSKPSDSVGISKSCYPRKTRVMAIRELQIGQKYSKENNGQHKSAHCDD